MGSEPRRDRVAELLEGALERPPAERAGWLEAECDGDRRLLAEVSSLLAASDPAESFFDALADAVRSIPEAELGPAAEGDRIGPYRIEAELGRGGMGVVYRARDTRLGRRVAIKVLPPWLADEEKARRRLVAEARAAAAIDHPNIAVLHDVVETPEGVVALVFAHYDGETLRDRLRRGPLAPDEALAIAGRIAEGLAAAHAHDIVHRDVKPSNVLLTPDDRVKILDFGVAAMLGADQTVSGRGGTVAYMAPEQIRDEPSDPRTDLWALGVVLYEMVAGARPFRGGSEAAVMRAILDDDPAPLAPWLDPLLRRLLARDPDARFPSADAAIEAMATAQVDAAAGTDPEAGVAGVVADGEARAGGRAGAPLSRWAGMGTRVRGTVPGRLAAATLVVGLLAGVAWLLGGRGPAPAPAGPDPAGPSPARVAVLPFTVRGAAELDYLREGLSDLLSASLHGAGGLRTVDPSALLARVRDGEGLDPATAGRIAAGFGAGRFVLGDVVAVAGRIRIRAGLYDGGAEPVVRAYVEGDVERLFNLVDEIAGKLLVAEAGGPTERLLQVASVTTSSLPAFKHYLEGERLLREGRFSRALEAFRRAVETDSLFALAHYRLSVAAGWSYRSGLSEAAAERAVELADRLPGLERRLVDAVLAWPNGELDRAESLYRAVLAEQPARMEAWYNLGELYFHMNPLRGRSMAEAREPFERAAALAGYDHYESLVHLADLAARDRRYDDYDSLFARLDPDAELAPLYRAQHAMVTGDPVDRAAALDTLRGGEPNAVRIVAGRLAAFATHVPAAATVAELLTAPDRPADWRAVGHLHTAIYEAGRGRWAEADRHLDAAATLAPGPTLLQRAYLRSLPFAPADDSTLAALRAALRTGPPPGPASNPFLSFHEPYEATLRSYLRGALADRAGDPDGVRRAAERLEARPGTALDDSLARALGRELRARLVDDPDARARLLVPDRGDFGQPYGRVARSPFFSRTAARWLLAESLYRAGRLDEAAGWYASFLGPYIHEPVAHGPAHLRLAALRDAQGRPAEAARHYRTVIELWRDGDPGPRAEVRRARERLAAALEP